MEYRSAVLLATLTVSLSGCAAISIPTTGIPPAASAAAEIEYGSCPLEEADSAEAPLAYRIVMDHAIEFNTAGMVNGPNGRQVGYEEVRCSVERIGIFTRSGFEIRGEITGPPTRICNYTNRGGHSTGIDIHERIIVEGVIDDKGEGRVTFTEVDGLLGASGEFTGKICERVITLRNSFTNPNGTFNRNQRTNVVGVRVH